MLESLLVTLREGIEAALVIGIILAYLKKTGLEQLNTYVKWGFILAVGASATGAVAFSFLGVDPENPVFEGVMYLLSGIFVLSMVIWMWRASGNIKNEMTGKLDQIVEGGNKPSGIGLLVFAFFMVFREGVETVLFISALGRDSSVAANLAGALAGLVIAAIIGYLMVYGGAKVNLGLFFKVTGAALLLLSFKLIFGGILEFAEVGLIPVGHEVEEILEFVAEGSFSQALSTVVVALPLGVFLYNLLRGRSRGGAVKL